MALPCFYVSPENPDIRSLPRDGTDLLPAGTGEVLLDEDNSRHIVQVLRMQKGEALQLTDGQGLLLTTAITDDHKKKCRVKITDATLVPKRERQVSLAVSLLKNTSRFEWLLEKATEIGVSAIIPLLGERTEKPHFRMDRMQQILISAMLQSQQCWLPRLQAPVPVRDLVAQTQSELRFIAHCLEEEKQSLAGWQSRNSIAPGRTAIILIGPEGDFSAGEIDWALQHQFIPVTLGSTRLRTETAGMVAATLLCID